MTASDAAQAFRSDGKLLKAREQFLVCADPSCPAIVEAACARWIDGLDKRIPSVVLHVHEADGRDAIDAQIQLDGKPLQQTPGSAVSLDPGTHAFRFVAPDGRVASEQIVVAEGEQLRRVDAVLPPRADGSGAVASTDTGASSSGAATSTSAVNWPAWTVAGGAVVAWGAFAGFAVSGNHDYSQAKDSCATGTCSGQYPTGKFVAADVALGVAIAATGVAAVLFLTHKSDTTVARAARVITTGVEF